MQPSIAQQSRPSAALHCRDQFCVAETGTASVSAAKQAQPSAARMRNAMPSQAKQAEPCADQCSLVARGVAKRGKRCIAQPYDAQQVAAMCCSAKQAMQGVVLIGFVQPGREQRSASKRSRRCLALRSQARPCPVLQSRPSAAVFGNALLCRGVVQQSRQCSA